MNVIAEETSTCVVFSVNGKVHVRLETDIRAVIPSVVLFHPGDAVSILPPDE